MVFFAHKPLAKSVTFDQENMIVELLDGRKIYVPLVYFPQLLQASSEQRRDYVISGGGVGLHWESIDEDIRVDHLLLGVFANERFYKTA